MNGLHHIPCFSRYLGNDHPGCGTLVLRGMENIHLGKSCNQSRTAISQYLTSKLGA
jgi:hypothetical protein